MKKKILFESKHINEEFGLSGINILCYKIQQNVAKEATLIILLFRYIESSFFFFFFFWWAYIKWGPRI